MADKDKRDNDNAAKRSTVSGRTDRLSAALRANLRKRKEQARARASETTASPSDDRKP